MNKDNFPFVVYVIHACADKWSLSPAQVYQKLKSYGCITHYLVPHYDVLHTLGRSYLVDDIENYIVKRGGCI